MLHSSHCAFREFRDTTRALIDLPDHTQNVALKRELFRALERAYDLRERAQDLERQLGHLTAERTERLTEHQAFAAQLNRDIATLIERHDREKHALREQVRSLKTQVEELDELSHSLLDAIESDVRAPAVHLDASSPAASPSAAESPVAATA
jgi:predicted nuclease with TOPRIM domain